MTTCKLCDYLHELYDRTDKTARDYWLVNFSLL